MKRTNKQKAVSEALIALKEAGVNNPRIIAPLKHLELDLKKDTVSIPTNHAMAYRALLVDLIAHYDEEIKDVRTHLEDRELLLDLRNTAFKKWRVIDEAIITR